MQSNPFSNKWSQLNQGRAEDAEEKVVFVEKDKSPATQRQLNFYYYFLFIKSILEKAQSQTVLDLGCGRGTMALYVADYLEKEVVLLDSSPDAINLAKNEFQKRGINANFYTADARQTNLSSHAFGAILAIGLAEHLENVGRLFKEEYRLLKPGGVLISLNVPKKFSIQFLNTWHRSVKKVFGRYKGSVKKDYYRSNLKPKDFKKIAEQSGFKDVKITHVCPFAFFAPVGRRTDRCILNFNKVILKIRSFFQKYPYKTNQLLAQAHFLVGYKP